MRTLVSLTLPLLLTLGACGELGNASDTQPALAADIDAGIADVQIPDRTATPDAPSSGAYTYRFGSYNDVDAAVDAATPCFDCLNSIEALVQETTDGSCPRITDIDKHLVEITGGCVTAGLVEFEGSMVIDRRTADEVLTTYDHFAIRTDRGTFEARGSYLYAELDMGFNASFKLSYTWEMGTERDGSFGYDLEVVNDGDASMIVGEVGVEAGTFAIDLSAARVEGCEIEPVANVALFGKDEALMVLDGDKTCDACGELSFDGGEPHIVCQ